MADEQRRQRIATFFAVDPLALEMTPSASDVPPGSRGAAARVWGLLVIVVAIFAVLLVLPRVLELASGFALPLQFGGLLVLLAGLFVLVPALRAHRAASRWNAAYLELAEHPVRSAARIARIDYGWRGERCVVTGRVRYGEPGDEREVAMGDGSLQPLTWTLRRGEVPSVESKATVWRTPDHSVVLVRVHADGTGG